MNIEELEKENTELRALLKSLCEVTTWCSGSSDFSPEGKAGKEWQDWALPILQRSIAFVGNAIRDGKFFYSDEP